MIIHNVRLKNGYDVQVAPLNGSINVKQISNFINSLVEESSFISRDKKITHHEQRTELKVHKRKIAQGLMEYLIALHGKNIIGQAMAERLQHRVRGNAFIRLYVAESYRQLGLGKVLMYLLLNGLKRKKVINAYIEVAEKNTPAIKFYKKFGFKKIALLPNWMEFDGRHINAIGMIMELKNHVEKKYESYENIL